MSERPNFFNSSEEEDDDDKKAAKRKKDQMAGFLADIFKDDTKSEDGSNPKEQDDAKLFDLLFRHQDKESGEESASSSADTDESLSQDEESKINSELADEHLKAPIVQGEPEEEVTDFLNNVKDGTKPEDAFQDTLDAVSSGGAPDNETAPANDSDATGGNESNLQPNLEADNHQSNEPEAHDDESTSEVPEQNEDNNNGHGEGGGGGDDDDYETNNDQAVPYVNYARRNVSSSMSAPQGVFPLRRHARTVKLPTSPKSVASPNESQIKEMERHLSAQEIVIQRLVQQNRKNQSIISPPERSQLPNQESRLKLVKPERVGQIGKMAMERLSQSERTEPKTGPERRVINGDVLTMSRRDLLEISAKIIVNGASLKSMFENSLFNERALRRMVGEYLKGKDIVPLLKKELISQEAGFEDNHQKEMSSRERIDAPGANDRIVRSPLSPAETLPLADIHGKQQAEEYFPKSQPSNNPVALPTSFGRRAVILNVVLALAAVVIIILIVWLLLRHRT